LGKVGFVRKERDSGTLISYFCATVRKCSRSPQQLANKGNRYIRKQLAYRQRRAEWEVVVRMVED